MTVNVKQRVTMTGGKGIVEVMRREGVEKVFCVPGESFLPVMDGLYEDSTIQLIAARHEGGASFMAEGYAKASGKVGVCMATRGVGSTNLAIGIHTAHQDSTPLVCLIGQVERDFRGREGFQEVELDQFYRHITKWTVEIRDAKRVPELLHRAFRIAQTGRPGPVVVSLPADMLYDEVEMLFQQKMLPSPPEPSQSQVEHAIELLMSAKRPLLLVGGGVSRTNAQNELVQLSEQLSIPVITSFRRHDAFPNNHKNYAGHIGLGPHPELVNLVQQADVILAIGMKFSQIVTQDYRLLAENTKLIHIDIDEEAIGKFYPTEIGIVSDAKAAIKAFQKATEGGKASEERSKYCRQVRDIYEKISTPTKAYSNEFVNLEGFIYDLQRLLPEQAIITNCAGNYTGWIHRYYQFNHPKTYIGPTSGAMGYSLPAAIGAKLAYPRRTVVSIAGDGGFMMTLQELETSVRYNIPVICIVINNNQYGTIRMHQERRFPSRVIGTELSNPDFVTIGKGFNIYAEKVETNEQFPAALERALQSSKTSLIEIITDPEQISVSSTIHQIREAQKN